MAIFSLNHSFVGRSKHAPGSAGFYARYITRSDACTDTVGERMPTSAGELIQWLDAQEKGDRKNARVIDKVIVALPVELSHEQNVELLREYCERMTVGRSAWMAAIHDGPRDADNPHAHIIFRDRDFETGKRVMLTTETGSTQRLREGWEQEVNIALQRGGFEQRIDCRSLADQGIDREPQLHVGAGASELTRQGYEFQSAEVQKTRLIQGEPVEMTINYPVIDGGKSRFEENEERKARNLLREIEETGYPYYWTGNASMPAQQDAAMLWNEIAQKRAAELFGEGTAASEASAIAWVRARTTQAELLYEVTVTGAKPADADPFDTMLVEQHLGERQRDVQAKDNARDASRSNAESWEAQMSEFGRAMREMTEQDQNRKRGMGLEM